jgi:hypothetical protein
MRLDCDEMDRQVLGRPVTRESGELWIDLEEDKTARAEAFGLLAEIGSGSGAPRRADIQHFGSANSTA